MKEKRFEDLKCWKEAHKLALFIYDATSGEAFARDAALRNAIRRCGASAGAKIARGSAHEKTKEFVHWLFVAMSYISELQSNLYLAAETELLSKESFVACYEKSKRTAALIEEQIEELMPYRAKKNPYSAN